MQAIAVTMLAGRPSLHVINNTTGLLAISSQWAATAMYHDHSHLIMHKTHNLNANQHGGAPVSDTYLSAGWVCVFQHPFVAHLFKQKAKF